LGGGLMMVLMILMIMVNDDGVGKVFTLEGNVT